MMYQSLCIQYDISIVLSRYCLLYIIQEYMIIFLHMVKRRSLYRYLFIGGGKDIYIYISCRNIKLQTL